MKVLYFYINERLNYFMKMYSILTVLFMGTLLLSFTSSSHSSEGNCVMQESLLITNYCLLDSPVVGITYTTVPRNVNAPFSVFVDKIRQDNKLIGNIHDGKKKNWEKAAVVYEISLPNGTKIAEAAAEEKSSQEVIIWTFRDNKKQKLPMYKGTLEMDMIVAKYLIEKGYL